MSRRVHRRRRRCLPALPWRKGALLVAVGFAASRVVIALAGVAFDAGPLDYAGQILGRSVLERDLVGSLVNLHAQPPLFNLFVGLVVNLVPYGLQATVFRASYLGMGLALALSLYAALLRVGVGPRTSVALALVFVASPSVFLYENWLLYDYPVALLLCLAVLCLQRYEEHGRLRDAGAFFAVVTTLVLTRSLFHLAWLLVWAGALVVHRRHGEWRRMAAVAAIPVVMVIAVYANSMRVSGTFASSSSLGLSLAKITVFQLTPAERSASVARGELSRVSLVDPLSPVDQYRGVLQDRPPTGVPALDEEVKGRYGEPPTSHGLDPNLNNILYVDASRQYLRDAVDTVRTRPFAYFRGLRTAYDLFFRPPSDIFIGTENRRRVAWLARLNDAAFDGVVSDTRDIVSYSPQAGNGYRQPPGRTGWLAIMRYGVALGAGAVVLARRARAGSRRRGVLALAFLWSTVAYVMVLSNALEVGENTRFRLYTEPLVLVLLAALVVEALRGGPAGGLAKRRGSPQPDAPARGPGASRSSGGPGPEPRVGSVRRVNP